MIYNIVLHYSILLTYTYVTLIKYLLTYYFEIAYVDRVFKRMRDDPEITNYVLVKNILKRKIINKSKGMTLRF